MRQLDIKEIIAFCRKQIDTERAKTVMQYLVFLFISFVFWLVLTLNNSYQQDFEIPLKITSIPDSTTLINDAPATIRVAIKDRGANMLKYSFGNLPTISIDFKEYADGNGAFRVPEAQLRSVMVGAFAGTANISSITPDSLRILYTNLPGKKVPVRLDLDIVPNLQYVINGAVRTSVDSVTVYSNRQTLSELTEVYTYHVREKELTDTLRREVAISPITGARIEPKNIVVTIPVEQLINKTQMVPVVTANSPGNVNVLTFPAMVEASFLVPQSMYRRKLDIKVAADYNEIMYATSNKVAVKVVEVPAICKSVSLSVDSVEYLIEKHGK